MTGKPRPLKVKTVDHAISQTGSDVVLRRIVQDHKGRRIQYRIRSNSYRDQCSAVVTVWNEKYLCWNVVISLDPGEMQTEPGIYAYPNQQGLQLNHFTKDLARLERLAFDILNGI